MLDRLRYLKYRFKYKYAPYLFLSKPVDVSLELSSYCNCYCGYCYHAQKKVPFKKEHMGFHTAETIIHDAADNEINSLKFNWRGESTLNPDFFKITKLAKDLASRSRFIDRISNSNFKFSTKNEDIFRAFCHQTKVKISLDSFSKNVYELQRSGSNHELVLTNINKLYNYPNRNNEIVIQAIRTELNKDEDIFGEVKKRWPSALVSVRNVVSDRNDKDITEVNSRDFNNRQRCLQAFNRLVFDTEGNAYPCCIDIKNQLILGNIYTHTIMELFNGPILKSLRKSLKNKSMFNFDPCKSCSSYESFKGFKAGWTS